MNLLALLFGLIVERLATQLFHLRRLRWLDRLLDSGFRLCERFGNWPPVIPVAILAILLVSPVFIVVLSLGDTLFGFPYLILAIIVGFMVLNYICMLSASWILKGFKPPIMNVFGIVLSVIQLGIGITWIYGGIGLKAMSIMKMIGS